MGRNDVSVKSWLKDHKSKTDLHFPLNYQLYYSKILLSLMMIKGGYLRYGKICYQED